MKIGLTDGYEIFNTIDNVNEDDFEVLNDDAKCSTDGTYWWIKLDT